MVKAIMKIIEKYPFILVLILPLLLIL